MTWTPVFRNQPTALLLTSYDQSSKSEHDELLPWKLSRCLLALNSYAIEMMTNHFANWNFMFFLQSGLPLTGNQMTCNQKKKNLPGRLVSCMSNRFCPTHPRESINCFVGIVPSRPPDGAICSIRTNSYLLVRTSVGSGSLELKVPKRSAFIRSIGGRNESWARSLTGLESAVCVSVGRSSEMWVLFWLVLCCVFSNSSNTALPCCRTSCDSRLFLPVFRVE